MKKLLGRKQTSKNADWRYAMAHIEELISESEVDAYASAAIERIRNAAAGTRAAYGWSAGKDSIVLSSLCREAGVTDCFFGHTELEFPAYMRWATAHRPENCEFINTGLDLKWLAAHPQLLFVDDAASLNVWYGLVQRSTFTRYFREHDAPLLIVGHRTMDGNTCGRDHYIRKISGETRFAAIADWPHEAVLGYLHYHRLALPPTYDWEDGWVFGPTPWPIWGRPETSADGFALIDSLDTSIVPAAAEFLPEARAYLEGRHAT